MKSSKSGTKERLLRAGIRLFSLKGYDGVSVDEIVTEAHANKRMVYHYFGNKEGLYQEALHEVFGRLLLVELASVNPGSDLDEVLEPLVQAYFDFLEANPEFVQLLLWENLARGRHLGAATGTLSKAPILQILHQVLLKGIQDGRIHPRLKTKHLLINIIGLCLIYFSNRYTLSRTVGLDLQSPKVLRDGVSQVVWLLKHGIGK